MNKDNIFSRYIKKLKYIKNDFVIKLNVIKKKRRKGEKVSIKDILIELKLIKPKKHTKANSNIVKKSNSKNKNIKNSKEPKNNTDKSKKSLYKVLTSTSLIAVSFLFSLIMFYQGSDIKFYRLTEDNESKILNILKSPKTETYIKSYYDAKNEEVECFVNIVDNLDSYSYRIKFDSMSDELKNEILLDCYKETSQIDSISDLSATSIVEYKNKLLINNNYNIDKGKVSQSDLEKMNESINAYAINNFENSKAIIISSMTASLSLISNLLYFVIKKVISKK